MKKLLTSRLSSKARMCLAHIIYDHTKLMTALSVMTGLIITISLYSVEAHAPSIEVYSTDSVTQTSVATTITSMSCMTSTTTSITTNTDISTSQTENITESSVAVTMLTDTSAESTSDTQVVIETTDYTEVYSNIEPAPTQSTSEVTNSDTYLLAALIQLEGGAETYECKLGIASTVVNRMSLYGGSLADILYTPGQFATASRLSNTTPSDECIAAAEEVLTSGSTLPVYVIFFRAGYYHSWGDQVPYAQLGNTYFSYSRATKEANS